LKQQQEPSKQHSRTVRQGYRFTKSQNILSHVFLTKLNTN